MVLEGDGKFHEPEASRAYIYVSQKLVNDSAFPFEDGQPLHLRIEPETGRLIVEASDREE